MVTTKRKLTVDSQKIKRRESKSMPLQNNHQFTKEGSKRERNKATTKQPENNKMT